MKIQLDDFLTAEQLKNATKEKPTTAVIKDVRFKERNELPFESEKGRYELLVELFGDKVKWLPNKTSLRAFKQALGIDADDWIDKEIKLWTVEQLVGKEMKKVVYANAA